VALKVLSAGALLDPKQVRRFEREAKAAARLHHTNIVPVFGVRRQDDHHSFVMQFIAGLGLDVVLAEVRDLRDRSAPPPGKERHSSNERSFRLLSARKDGQAARSLTRVGSKSGR
jgi:serine/threonine protein kinase